MRFCFRQFPKLRLMHVKTWIFQLFGNIFKIQTLWKCIKKKHFKKARQRNERFRHFSELIWAESSAVNLRHNSEFWCAAPSSDSAPQQWQKVRNTWSPGPDLTASTHLSRPTLSVLGPQGDNLTPLLLFRAGAHASLSAMNTDVSAVLTVSGAAAITAIHWNIREVLHRHRRILLPLLTPRNRLEAEANKLHTLHVNASVPCFSK